MEVVNTRAALRLSHGLTFHTPAAAPRASARAERRCKHSNADPRSHAGSRERFQRTSDLSRNARRPPSTSHTDPRSHAVSRRAAPRGAPAIRRRPIGTSAHGKRSLPTTARPRARGPRSAGGSYGRRPQLGLRGRERWVPPLPARTTGHRGGKGQGKPNLSSLANQSKAEPPAIRLLISRR
jgi:hypothetical protein